VTAITFSWEDSKPSAQKRRAKIA